MTEIETKPDVREGIIHTAIPPEEVARLSDDIVAALKTVYDPEIPSDIFELGLIYKIDIEDDRTVKIVMTLTAPGCPVAGEMPGWVENAVGAVEGVAGVHHLHLWQMQEHDPALDAHLIIEAGRWSEADTIKQSVKSALKDQFGLSHTTLELECAQHACKDAETIG